MSSRSAKSLTRRRALRYAERSIRYELPLAEVRSKLAHLKGVEMTDEEIIRAVVRCKHCGRKQKEHVELQCLFMETKFTPKL